MQITKVGYIVNIESLPSEAKCHAIDTSSLMHKNCQDTDSPEDILTPFISHRP